MATLKKKQVEQLNTSTEELLKTLSPRAIKKTSQGSVVIEKLTDPATKMPSSPTENFTYALCLAFCFFQRNHSTLMKHGDALRKYTDKLTNLAPAEDAPFVKKNFDKLFKR